MCEKTCYDGKLANNVIYVKYRISVSDTVKVAQIHAFSVTINKKIVFNFKIVGSSIQSVTIALIMVFSTLD